MAEGNQKELDQSSLSPYPHPVETPAVPIRSGNKYICPHCQAQVPVKQDCPSCRLEIDWTKI
jgi:predicted amidophosphoribosyltransferase